MALTISEGDNGIGLGFNLCVAPPRHNAGGCPTILGRSSETRVRPGVSQRSVRGQSEIGEMFEYGVMDS